MACRRRGRCLELRTADPDAEREVLSTPLAVVLNHHRRVFRERERKHLALRVAHPHLTTRCVADPRLAAERRRKRELSFPETHLTSAEAGRRQRQRDAECGGRVVAANGEIPCKHGPPVLSFDCRTHVGYLVVAVENREPVRAVIPWRPSALELTAVPVLLEERRRESDTCPLQCDIASEPRRHGITRPRAERARRRSHNGQSLLHGKVPDRTHSLFHGFILLHNAALLFAFAAYYTT